MPDLRMETKGKSLCRRRERTPALRERQVRHRGGHQTPGALWWSAGLSPEGVGRESRFRRGQWRRHCSLCEVMVSRGGRGTWVLRFLLPGSGSYAQLRRHVDPAPFSVHAHSGYCRIDLWASNLQIQETSGKLIQNFQSVEHNNPSDSSLVLASGAWLGATLLHSARWSFMRKAYSYRSMYCLRMQMVFTNI